MPQTDLVVGPNEPDNEEFGKLLKQFRLQKGLTRLQAAQRCGFTSEYLRLIEHGKRTPAAGNMPLIFGVYDVAFTVVDNDFFVIEGASIKFSSRILEARKQDVPRNLREPTRAIQIGRIVELLMDADETKLRRIYQMLKN
jgi:transcriptional regulator with XRE-family HTH domain